MFLQPLILQATKVTENSKTLIDNIFFNSSSTGIITYSISDHLIQFLILVDFIKPSLPCKSNTYKQNFKNFGRNNLKEDFGKIDWNKVIHENGNNVNDAFGRFYKSLTEILNHHVPLTKITKK